MAGLLLEVLGFRFAVEVTAPKGCEHDTAVVVSDMAELIGGDDDETAFGFMGGTR